MANRKVLIFWNFFQGNFFAGFTYRNYTTVEYKSEFIGIYLGCPGQGRKGHKASTLKFFMEEDKAVAIKKNGLAGLAIFSDEEKEGTGEEIKIHLLDDNIGQGVVALPHVGVQGIEKNGVLGIKNHVRSML